MEETEEKKENPRLGESIYDDRYEMWHCCRCDELVALYFCDEDRLLAQQKKELAPFEEVERLQREIHDYYGGHRLSRTQVIHARCLAVLSDHERTVIRAKARFALPLPLDAYHFYSVTRCYNQAWCGYCSGTIGAIKSGCPGFGYVPRVDEKAPRQYLHYACFFAEWQEQYGDNRTSAERYNEPPRQPTERDPLSLRKKSLEWEDYLSRFVLNKKTREQYLVWRRREAEAAQEWNEQQREQWRAYEPTLPEEIATDPRYDEKKERDEARVAAKREREASEHPPAMNAEKRRRATTLINMLEIRDEKDVLH